MKHTQDNSDRIDRIARIAVAIAERLDVDSTDTEKAAARALLSFPDARCLRVYGTDGEERSFGESADGAEVTEPLSAQDSLLGLLEAMVAEWDNEGRR